jgi:hypothetical protein
MAALLLPSTSSSQETPTCTLSDLPMHALAIIHGLVCRTGGVRSALCLEATCKALRDQFLSQQTRFNLPRRLREGGLVVGSKILSNPKSRESFWAWTASHGHRLDFLSFHLDDDDDNLPAPLHLDHLPTDLAAQPGVADVRSVAVKCEEKALQLMGLEGLPNLQKLRSWRQAPPGAAGAAVSSSIVQSLESLVGLKDLSLWQSNAFTSLDFLTALTAVTRLRLMGVSQLTSLRPSAPFLLCHTLFFGACLQSPACSRSPPSAP